MKPSERTLTFPGFVDVHVHFRDPGVPEAETTASGLAAAERGGFAAVVTMPNTTPAIDSPEAIDCQRRKEKGERRKCGCILFPSAISAERTRFTVARLSLTTESKYGNCVPG